MIGHMPWISCRHAIRQTDIHTGSKTDTTRQVLRQAGRQMSRQIDNTTVSQTGRQEDRQTGIDAGRQLRHDRSDFQAINQTWMRVRVTGLHGS